MATRGPNVRIHYYCCAAVSDANVVANVVTMYHDKGCAEMLTNDNRSSMRSEVVVGQRVQLLSLRPMRE